MIHMQGIGRIPSAAMSSPVRQAITPGMRAASVVSTATISAWPCGERTNAA